jgi:hypothetical protein
MTDSLNFRPIEISDRQWVADCVRHTDFRGCEYSFGTAFMWSPIFDIQIAKYDNFCLYRTRSGFWIPAGQGDLCDFKQVVDVLREYCRESGRQLIFTNADVCSVERLRTLFGEEIEIAANRDYCDYIYDFDSLATLRGRKLHGKRNHIHRFNELDWCFEPITPCNTEEVVAMHNRWCEAKGVYDDPEALREAGAVIRGLDAFCDLGFIGGLIRVDGEIQAYTFGSAVGNRRNDTFTVHVEKAFASFQGIYAAINKEFVNYVGDVCGAFEYINREEDMGVENLRKAKLSYRPAFLHEKYRVKLGG